MAGSSQLVKELREKTGAGILDCQKALTENGDDIEKSIDYLRQKGLAAAAKKAGRETNQGLQSTRRADEGNQFPCSQAKQRSYADVDFIKKIQPTQCCVGWAVLSGSKALARYHSPDSVFKVSGGNAVYDR